MKNRGLILGTIAGLALAAPGAFADGTTVSSSNALLNGLTFNAYLDGYYGYNFNHPATLSATNPSTIPASQNGSYRVFDQYSNQFSLNLAELEVSKQGKEAGFLVDFDFGEQADTIANSAAAAGGGSTDGVSKNIGQAYMTYSPAAVSGLSFKFGKMYSPLGWESAKAKDSWQYSRSILDFSTPFWVTGLDASYALVAGKLALSGMVFDGWNTLYSVNAGKNYGGQLAWTPSESLAVTYNVVTGPNQVGDSGDWRTVHEANAVYTINPTYSVAADVEDGMGNNEIINGAVVPRATWQAAEFAAKMTVNPRYYISPRYEAFWDHQGFTTGTPQTVQEVTFTNGFDLGNGLLTRVEFRYDWSSADVYQSNNGLQTNQVTGTVGLMYVL